MHSTYLANKLKHTYSMSLTVYILKKNVNHKQLFERNERNHIIRGKQEATSAPRLALEEMAKHLNHKPGNCNFPPQRDVQVGLKHYGRKLSPSHSRIVASMNYGLLQI